MKENILYIEYNNGNGHMRINMDNFFPVSQARLKKLIKIIELDYQHCEELKEKLKVYFQEKVAECDENYREAGKLYFDYKQKTADTQRMIQSRKHPNGVPLSEEELKAERENVKVYRETANDNLSRANSNKRNKDRFSNHLEYMNSL